MEKSKLGAILLFIFLLSLSACRLGDNKLRGEINQRPLHCNGSLSYFQDQSEIEFSKGSFVNAAYDGSGSLQIKEWEASERSLQVGDTNFDVSGLVGLWRLNNSPADEVTNQNILDASGNGHHGVLSTSEGAADKSTSGKINGAIDFDGSDDWISIPDSSEFDFGTGDFSFSAWIKTIESCSGIKIYFGRYTGTVLFELGCIDDSGVGKASAEVRDSAGNSVGDLPSITQINDGLWHHLVGVKEGNSVSIFVDGNLEATDVGTFTGNFDSAANIVIGGNYAGGYYPDADIDEVSLWSKALQESEVRTLYQRQQGAYGGGVPSTFTSQIFTLLTPLSEVRSFEYQVEAPYGKEIPINENEEGLYSTGGVDKSDLFALWHITGTEGDVPTSIVDSGSGGYDGSIIDGGNSSLKYTAGRFNQGVVFDGVDDCVRIDGLPDPFKQTYTVSFWFKTNTVPGSEVQILDYEAAGSEAPLHFGIFTSGTIIGATIRDSVGTNVGCGVPNRYADDLWHHAVAVREGGDSGSITVRVYLDGKEMCSDTGAIGITTAPGVPLAIGCRSPSLASRFFEGEVDEVAIWTRRLQDSEIEKLYERGILNLRYQVRSCNLSDCSDATFVGIDGSNGTYFSEKNRSLLGNMSFDLTSLGLQGRYFQYRALFSTEDSAYTPELKKMNLKCSE